jgi:hypothetical protein
MALSVQDSGKVETTTVEASSAPDITTLANSSDRPLQTTNEPESGRPFDADTSTVIVETTEGEKHVNNDKEDNNEKKVDGEEKAEDKEEGNDQKLDNEAKSGTPPPPKLPPTRIGRPNKNDRKDIIDQADWQTMVPTKDPETKFVASVTKGDDDREQITLYSPYIQKVFRAVIR